MFQNKVLVIIVHGNQVLSDGSLDPEYRDRCKLAVTTAQNGTATTSYIILTGGETVKGLPAEAEVAACTVCNMLFEEGVDAEVLIEANSRTTGENIFYSHKLLKEKNIFPDNVVFIGRESQIAKIRVISWRIWEHGCPNFTFVSGVDHTPKWYRLLDKFFMPIISLLDPKDIFILAGYKRLFRNA